MTYINPEVRVTIQELNEEEERGYFLNEYLNEDESINTNVF